MAKSDYTVGQVVFVVTDRGSVSGRDVKVAKVGHKWITLEDDRGTRFDPETGEVDCGKYTSRERVWLSESHWHDALQLQDTWNSLHRKLQYAYRPPAGMTLEKIRQINTIFGFEET